MKLITKEIEKRAPRLYANEFREPKDIQVVAKLFTPDSSLTWYMTEYDPAGRLAFGYTRNDAAPECAELGYFSITELEAVRGKFGLPVERDLHFGPATLAEVMSGAKR